MKIIEKVKFLRELNNYTQEYLAELLNISANGYGRIERGEVRVDIERLGIISKAFDLKPSELIDLELHEIVKKLKGCKEN
jgi:transcriptional regulator with XRE-family HTH domain